MYIYSIYPKDGTKEIYIGKTNNIKQGINNEKADAGHKTDVCFF